ILPEGTGVNLTFTMNARELMHAFDLRLAKDAQWEIRQLFTEVLKLVKPLAPKVFEAYSIPEDTSTGQVMTDIQKDETDRCPCIGCKKQWYAERHTTCYDMCTDLDAWKARHASQKSTSE